MIDPNTICAFCGIVRSQHEAFALCRTPNLDEILPGTLIFQPKYNAFKQIQPLRDNQGLYVEDFEKWIKENKVEGLDPRETIAYVVKWGGHSHREGCAEFIEPVEVVPVTEVAPPTPEQEEAWRPRALFAANRAQEQIEESNNPDSPLMEEGLNKFREGLAFTEVSHETETVDEGSTESRLQLGRKYSEAPDAPEVKVELLDEQNEQTSTEVSEEAQEAPLTEEEILALLTKDVSAGMTPEQIIEAEQIMEATETEPLTKDSDDGESRS